MKETIINLFFNKILNPYHPIFSKANLDTRYKWISCNIFECRDNQCYFLFYRIDELGNLKYVSVDFNTQDILKLVTKHDIKDLYLNNNSAMYNFKWGKNAKLRNENFSIF